MALLRTLPVSPRHKLRTFGVLALALAAAGCAGKAVVISPAQNFNASMTQAVMAAEETREEILLAAGRAYAQGILSENYKAWILEAGDNAKLGIDATKTVLTRFIEEGGSRAPVYASMAVLDQIMLDLILRRHEALDGAGVVLP
jgi:hypothetical protein